MNLEHESTGTTGKLRGKSQRLRDLTPADPSALRAAVEGNAPVNFDPGHPASTAIAHNGQVVIGSKSKSYNKLLWMPFELVASAYRKFVAGDLGTGKGGDDG